MVGDRCNGAITETTSVRIVVSTLEIEELLPGQAQSGLIVELLQEGVQRQVPTGAIVKLLQEGVQRQDRGTVTIVMRATTKGESSVLIVGL
jgi:hypothetical protein